MPPDPDHDHGDPPAESIRRTFDTAQRDPNVAVVSTVAELSDVPVEELPPLYHCIDQILERLFDDPPDPDADASVSFSYAGYRVTVRQGGQARFEPLR